jgi:hypothetical protein
MAKADGAYSRAGMGAQLLGRSATAARRRLRLQWLQADGSAQEQLMKKSILSAIAVAAFSIGGAAQADVIDSVGNAISRIFGIPYDARPAGAAPVVNVYTDANGRRYQVDANGRHIPLDPYGNTYAMGSRDDRDGDGVANLYDRAPDDPRYR